MKTDETLGLLFNALFLTDELKEKKEDVTLFFQGSGARWSQRPSLRAHT